MSFQKVKDIAVVTGSYTDRATNQSKNRYKNIGCVMKDDTDGRTFLLLDRSFNPAGVPFKDGTDQIALSLFDPRDDNDRPARAAAAPAAPARTTADDDVPF
jgi:hypothetical protein